MLGRLGKQSPMFPPKKEENKWKEMLGRLLLVIHWLTVLPAIYFIVGIAEYLLEPYFGKSSLGSELFVNFLLYCHPYLIFLLIYWIVKKKWAFFPWQHIKD